MECAPRYRRVRPGGRSQVPPATAPEERGGGGKSKLRQHPGPGNATLHLPSPHQGQVVVVTSFTVAVTSLVRVGAAESTTVWASGFPKAQAEPRGRLEVQAMRTSGRSCRVPQNRLAVAILIYVPAACQGAFLKSCKGANQCQWWSLSPVAPYQPFPQI